MIAQFVMHSDSLMQWLRMRYDACWQYLADIEEHLGVTIDVVDVDIKIETNQFDGKVVYDTKHDRRRF